MLNESKIYTLIRSQVQVIIDIHYDSIQVLLSPWHTAWFTPYMMKILPELWSEERFPHVLGSRRVYRKDLTSSSLVSFKPSVLMSTSRHCKNPVHNMAKESSGHGRFTSAAYMLLLRFDPSRPLAAVFTELCVCLLTSWEFPHPVATLVPYQPHSISLKCLMMFRHKGGAKQ